MNDKKFEELGDWNDLGAFDYLLDNVQTLTVLQDALEGKLSVDRKPNLPDSMISFLQWAPSRPEPCCRCACGWAVGVRSPTTT